MTNDGRFNWQSSGSTNFIRSNTVCRNNGTFDYSLNGWMRDLGTNNRFDNAGTLRKSGGSGDLLIDMQFTNRSGAVLDATSGNIRYLKTSTLEAGTVFAGTGRHEFDSTNTYTFGGAFVVANNNLHFDRGTFVNAGTERLDPTTNLNWSGGTLQGKWGTAEGRTLFVTNGFEKNWVDNYTNDGTVAWNSSNNTILRGTLRAVMR